MIDKLEKLLTIGFFIFLFFVIFTPVIRADCGIEWDIFQCAPVTDDCYCNQETGFCDHCWWEGNLCGDGSYRLHCLLYQCDPPECCCGGGGGCFEGDTPISTPDGEGPISDLKEGDMVSSYDPETGSESSSIIQKTYELTREAYYKIRTKDGEEVKVTAEHPLYAKQGEVKPLTFWEYLKTESLTKKLVDRLFK